jgi:hypothetical protein
MTDVYYYERVPMRHEARKVDASTEGFEVPHDVVKTIGGGIYAVGLAILHDVVPGGHVMHGPVISPDTLKTIGDGDASAGRKVLNKLVAIVRRQRSR